MPLLVAATARREELDAGHPVSELATGLQALGRCTRDRARTAHARGDPALAEQLRRAPLDGTEAERLLAASEGNPLYLVEAAQADSAPAGRVQAVIAARLARLSPPAAELAGVAATIGREFSAPVLADAAGVDDRAFAGGLDELWRRGIVRAHEHDLYDFSHGRIREAAYARIGPAQRRAQHLRVARALERARHLRPRRRWPRSSRRRERARRRCAGTCGRPTPRSSCTTTPARSRRSSARSPCARAGRSASWRS